jgi:hypothetical protein
MKYTEGVKLAKLAMKEEEHLCNLVARQMPSEPFRLVTERELRSMKAQADKLKPERKVVQSYRYVNVRGRVSVQPSPEVSDERHFRYQSTVRLRPSSKSTKGL